MSVIDTGYSPDKAKRMAAIAANVLKQRADFLNSPVFCLMRDTLVGGEPKTATNSDFHFDSEKARERLGWAFMASETIELFFQSIADHNASSVDIGSLSHLEGQGTQFKHHGLYVTVSSGRNANITVKNEAAYLEMKKARNSAGIH